MLVAPTRLDAARRLLANLRIVGIVISLVGTARNGWARAPTAAELEQQAFAHREAGQAHARGEPGGDPEGFDKCAAAFIDVFNSEQDHEHADMLLWNAADCSVAAGLIGQALNIWTTLIDRFPASEFVEDSLHALAELHGGIASYEQSAGRYEQFAAQYPKDQRATSALQNAYLFRLGLDQPDAAMQDLAQYESLYIRKDVLKAAAIFWSQHGLLDSSKAQRKHALDYLDKYGTKGGLDRAIVAEAVIGQIDWRSSCREPLLFDVCISVERESARAAKLREIKAKQTTRPGAKPRVVVPKRCGASVQGIVTVHTRDPKLSAAAQARFQKILKTVDRGGGKVAIPEEDWARTVAFQQAWAMAIVYQADQQYEDYLRVELPAELDFVDAGSRASQAKRDDSYKRLSSFFEHKVGLAGQLRARYAAVKATGSSHWTLVAAARAADVMQHFVYQLARAKVPRGLHSEAQVEAYCATLADLASPVQEEALSAWEYCVDRSTQYQYFNEFSWRCEAEAAERMPTNYWVAQELFGVSAYASSGVERVGVLDDPGTLAEPGDTP